MEKVRNPQPIVTPAEFIEEVESFILEHGNDKEALQDKMDTLMMAVLTSMGYEEGVKIYEDFKKKS